MTKRDTTLHLLFTREDGRNAIHTVKTDKTTYYGANIAEAARQVGIEGRPLRRIHFKFHGVQDGVNVVEAVWHLHAVKGAEVHWSRDFTASERQWIETARTPTVTPWFQEGWFSAALAWLDGELTAQGWTRVGVPRTLKHWQISLLWEVPTTHGRVFLKGVPDFFGREAQLTPRLAQELSGAAPPVLAADLARGLLLMADAGEPVDEQDVNWPALLRHLARVQQNSIPLLPDWHLRDRGPEYVLSWLDTLLAEASLLTGQESGFTPDEAQRLSTARPRLEAALKRLSRSPLPRTLGHGDLHGGNVLVKDGQFTLLDWSDVCQTHPFMDVNPAYFIPNPWQNSPDADHAQLSTARTAYLQAWTAYAPAEELEQLLKDGELTGELFRALGYMDGIYGAVQDKTEWHGAHLLHLRKILNMLEGT
ncbi:phosphotransferase [Deinococcus fonticola]|uniref:phosphotransferase n=1 Tax=Deinococcus fonticola TaxID=2528713 RepID=UPI00107558D8|nr:phosphotransferase [Deinococcus fonticola]